MFLNRHLCGTKTSFSVFDWPFGEKKNAVIKSSWLRKVDKEEGKMNGHNLWIWLICLAAQLQKNEKNSVLLDKMVKHV